MCGIVAKLSKTNKGAVNEDIADQFDEQRSRGVKGFGFIGIDENGNTIVRRSREETKILADLYKEDFPSIIFHHRMPTSSENTQRQTHPMYITSELLDNDYLIVHNGVIRNAEELKEDHEKMGFVYLTAVEEVTRKWVGPTYKQGKVIQKGEYREFTSDVFNDTEALAIEVALVIEGRTKQIEALGSAAVIAAQLCKETGKIKQYFFLRNTANPLKMLKTTSSIMLSSEGPGENIEPFVLHSVKPWSITIEKKPIAFAEEKKVESVPVAAAKTVGFGPRGNTASTAVQVAQNAANKGTGTSSSVTAPQGKWDAEDAVSEEAKKIFQKIDEIEENKVQLYLSAVSIGKDRDEQLALDELFFEYEERASDEIFSILGLVIEKGLSEDINYKGQDLKSAFAHMIDDLITDIKIAADTYEAKAYASYLID